MIPQMFGNYWTTYSLSRKGKTLKIYQKVNQHKYYNCKNFLVHNTIRSFLVSWQTFMSSDPFRKGLISSKPPPPPLVDAFDRKITVKNTTTVSFYVSFKSFQIKKYRCVQRLRHLKHSLVTYFCYYSTYPAHN